MSGHGRVLMSETDQFWEYAKEAMLLVCDAKTAKDKQDLLELSGTWTQAALQSRSRQLARSVPRNRLKRLSLGQVRPVPLYIKAASERRF
jgi:hypothetical protein